MSPVPEIPIPAEVTELVASLQHGEYETMQRCERCGDPLYSQAERDEHNKILHYYGPTGTVWAEAEPETRRAD